MHSSTDMHIALVITYAALFIIFLTGANFLFNFMSVRTESSTGNFTFLVIGRISLDYLLSVYISTQVSPHHLYTSAAGHLSTQFVSY